MRKIIILFCVITFTFCKNVKPVINADKVIVNDDQLMVNNTPYIIKGICYHPVPVNKNKRSFNTLTQDLELMKEAGINTIRIYEPIADEKVLNQIAASGLKVIIGFGYNQDGKYDIRSGTFIDYIENYKNHEAILMWELGNEYNYHPEWFNGDVKNWYKALNDSAIKIKKIDNNHPVTTAHGELPDSLALDMITAIDVWGMNVYRWDDPATIFEQWKSISDKPMYLSEAGGDSYMTITKNGYQKGANEKAQADANNKILKAVFSNLEHTLGVTLFSFTDGWWKAGENDKQNPGGWAPNSSGVPYDGTPNEEYWGIVDMDRKKKKTFEIIKINYTRLPK